MRDIASLTFEEATERAGLLRVERYDIEVDLRGLLEGDVVASTSTITFSCSSPGAATFVDCAADVTAAELNGGQLDLGTVERGRIPLTGLAEDNVLVVSATQSDTGGGSGVLRTVDPTDGLVYVWTSFEPDEARRLWACFDQPDLKAVHGFTVHAPESWTVLSNSAPDDVRSAAAGDARTWTFADTPRLSTYVVVVNAGPFHEIRSRRAGHDLGLYARQSLRGLIERDAEDIFTLTAQGLDFYADRFGLAFPQERYDQVFVPDLGGAMENWGCVTWGDVFLARSAPSHGERAHLAVVLLHEMAHMWFGDLVTMRWWEDLWLNEAFASFASFWAASSATEFTDTWAEFLLRGKLAGYAEDMSPMSHPISLPVPDVEHAMANFDAITYEKGASVLRQLATYVGEEAFTRGLQAYFAEHAWGNTSLDDLMGAVGQASGRDLGAWTTSWLERAGTDRLVVEDGVLVATAPDGAAPRNHHLEIGCFDRDGSALVRTATVMVETEGTRTPLELAPAAVYLPNDGDLTFASVRWDADSAEVLLAEGAALPDVMSRAVAIGTVWDQLVTGDLPSARVARFLLDLVEREESPPLAEEGLRMAQDAIELWTTEVDRGPFLERLADVAASLARHDDLRRPALRVLAAAANSEAHHTLVEEAATEDVDLAWRHLGRRAELGEDVSGTVADLRAVDPDPDAAYRALAVRASAPSNEAKQEAWQQLFVERSVPASQVLLELAQRFWRPGQTDLLLPWAHRWFDTVQALPPLGMLATLSLVGATYPGVGDDAVLVRAHAAAAATDVPPPVHSILVTGADRLERMIRARRT